MSVRGGPSGSLCLARYAEVCTCASMCPQVHASMRPPLGLNGIAACVETGLELECVASAPPCQKSSGGRSCALPHQRWRRELPLEKPVFSARSQAARTAAEQTRVVGATVTKVAGGL
eukprot:9483197-Pyramimonas_sp.AAC.1